MLSQRSALRIHDIVSNLIQKLLIINPVEKKPNYLDFVQPYRVC